MDNTLQEVPREFRLRVGYYRNCEPGEWINNKWNNLYQVIEMVSPLEIKSNVHSLKPPRTIYVAVVDARTKRPNPLPKSDAYQEWEQAITEYLQIPTGTEPENG